VRNEKREDLESDVTRAEPSAEQSAEPSADTAESSPAVGGRWAKMTRSELAEIQNRRAAPLIRCSEEMTPLSALKPPADWLHCEIPHLWTSSGPLTAPLVNPRSYSRTPPSSAHTRPASLVSRSQYFSPPTPNTDHQLLYI
jgi:hypothetical protein